MARCCSLWGQFLVALTVTCIFRAAQGSTRYRTSAVQGASQAVLVNGDSDSFDPSHDIKAPSVAQSESSYEAQYQYSQSKGSGDQHYSHSSSSKYSQTSGQSQSYSSQTYGVSQGTGGIQHGKSQSYSSQVVGQSHDMSGNPTYERSQGSGGQLQGKSQSYSRQTYTLQGTRGIRGQAEGTGQTGGTGQTENQRSQDSMVHRNVKTLKRGGQALSVKLEYTEEQNRRSGQMQGGAGGSLAAARRQLEEERLRKEMEASRNAEEVRRMEDEERRREEERRVEEEEERRREDEERTREEEERRREEERKRQEDIERQRIQEERRRIDDQERRRLEEETRRKEEQARASERAEEAARRQKLIEERERIQEERKRQEMERQARLEERRIILERKRLSEARSRGASQGSETVEGQITPTQASQSTRAASSSSRNAQYDSLIRNRCTDCTVGNQTFRGHSRFEYKEKCLKYKCICHCDGSHDCPAHHTTNVCDEREAKNARRTASSCQSCDAKGKIVTGNSYFDLQDGCTLFSDCKCFCDGKWECSVNRTKNTCVQKAGAGSCRECEVYGSFYPGNNRFTYQEGCFEYGCDCKCDGTWTCPPDRTKDTCRKGCGECEVLGEFFEGNSYFTQERGCTEYTCYCNCSGEWKCPVQKNICDAKDNLKTECSRCQVSETEVYAGNTNFQLRKKCINYECTCKCDGSWDCPGVLARNICRGERPGGCKSCQVSDEEYYPGDSKFDMRKECIHYKCRCNCDGSWNCPGEDARDVCKGETPGGCKSCKLSEVEFYRGDTDFQMRRGCLHYHCHCNCDGSWNCPGAAARNVCRGEIPGGCKSCQLSDGSSYPGYAKFQYKNGCFLTSCRCLCNGTVACDDKTVVNTCTGSAKTARPRDNRRKELNCSTCSVEGTDYPGDSKFDLKRGCYVYPCSCDCNGRWGCDRDGAVNTCAGNSALRKGSSGTQKKCQECIVQGRRYEGDTDFRLRRGCISYKCKCACDGRWECPADKASNFCPGSQEPTYGCKKCEVDGQSFTVDTNFEMRRGCVRYKCKCRCDGSYGCHVTHDTACHTGEIPAVCGNCQINGYVYPGNMSFLVRNGCTQMECNCYCNGTYNCPEKDQVDICRNRQQSNFLRDGTFTSTGNLGQTFGSGTRVFNQGGQQYTVTRKDYGGVQNRGLRFGPNGIPVYTNSRHVMSGGQLMRTPSGQYVLRGSIPLGGPVSQGQIVTHGGKQYVLRGMRQFYAPSGAQFVPIGAVPSAVQRKFYQQVISPHFANGVPTGPGDVKKQGGMQSYAEAAGLLGKRSFDIPSYGSASIQTADVNSTSDMRYKSAVFSVNAPYKPGQLTKYRHLGQVAVNPKPGCNNCTVERKNYKGGSKFKITKDCVEFDCNCECTGSWTCSGEFSAGCGRTKVEGKQPKQDREHRPQGDAAKTCRNCHVHSNTIAGGKTFPLVQSCFEYTCRCLCSGTWYCPTQEPKNICSNSRGELREKVSSSCSVCDVRGTEYPAHADFLLKDNCLQYSCKCNCDGSWVCTTDDAVNICQERRNEEERKRSDRASSQRRTTRLPTNFSSVFTTRVPRGQLKKYSNIRNGVQYKPTACKTCVVNGKSYIPENEFKFREECAQYTCQCFCNGTWECPQQHTVNLCRSPDYRVDGCRECSVKNDSYPGGSPFQYTDGCWQFNCFCGCNGEHSCPPERTVDTCKSSGSVASTCKPCLLEGRIVNSKSTFNMKRGCSEFLCDCHCNGTWTCPPERSINVCEEEGKIPSQQSTRKGCSLGNRTFYTRLFAYTENCIRYTCICYDNGAWKCPPQKSRRVC